VIDDKSPSGSWSRELAARGVHECKKCGWLGRKPSITDASSTVERDGRLEVDRTHLLVCPACLEVLSDHRHKESSP
jgi:hypothetical protein